MGEKAMGDKAKEFWSGNSWKSFSFARILEETDRYEDMVKVSSSIRYIDISYDKPVEIVIIKIGSKLE